jgi:hypothetical protein
MITVRMTTDVKDDRQVVLTLPPEVPVGRAQLVVTVESPQSSDPRGVPASAIRGIAAGDGPPPDDATVAQWLQERRAERYE